MPTFVYNALDRDGKTAKGTLTAETRSAALDQVSSRGLVPVSIHDQGSAKVTAIAASATGVTGKVAPTSRRVSKAHVEGFTRELANLLSAGVPLGKALHILRREAKNPAAKEQWNAIHDDVVGGKPLAEALARWPKSFPPVYVAMVRAGELGGFLDVVLNQIADFRARESELKGKVVSAMIYPAVLATVASFVLIFLLTYFIPKFAPIFKNFGANLPLITQIVIGVSNVLIHYGWIVALVGVVIVITVMQALRSENGQRFKERFLLSTPGLGLVLSRFALVRFARMLGTLLGAGVPLIGALRVAQDALGNRTLSDAVALGVEEVKRGSTLSRGLATCEQVFPPSVIEMLAVAEESARLDKELLRLAASFEGELDRKLRMLVSLAEPALLFIMAALIGTIVIGMLLPIFTLQELIK